MAKKGFKVLILEKERLPRPKVCAGGLPVKVAQLLDFDLSPAFETQVFRSLPPFEADLGEMGGWMVTRANLDHLIVQKAVEAGAELQEGRHVQEVEMGPDMVLMTITVPIQLLGGWLGPPAQARAEEVGQKPKGGKGGSQCGSH